MKHVVILIVALVVLGCAAWGVWWYINQEPARWFWLQGEFARAVDALGLGRAEEQAGVAASGFIEADEANVNTDLGGRIVALYADEGDEVQQGDMLVQLDDSLLLAQIEQAKAALQAAEATLARVEAGTRHETLDHAQAQLGQAQAAQQAARIAWEDAQTLLKRPQELDLAITKAKVEVSVAGHREEQAKALADSAQAARDLSDEAVAMLEDFEPVTVEIPVAPGKVIYKRFKLPSDALDKARQEQATATYGSWQAWTGYAGAQTTRAGAESYLAELERQRANPLSLQAQVDKARSQYEIATAAVGVAQAYLDGLKMGATPEQIAVAEAQVAMARSALEELQVQLAKFILQAPISGLVLERPVHVGEVALPGAPLMTLADLDDVSLTLYVPEGQLGNVQLGQRVAVQVDAYPDRTFPGTVTFIASQAEFTPKNVQTREERVNMVFAVRIDLPNADHALKPGMPADAVLADGTREGGEP